MIQLDYLIDAISTAFKADANMTALCPGGIWHRRALDTDHGGKRPAAVLTATALPDKEFFSDGSCIQSFVANLTIYGNEETATTGQIANFLGAWDFDRTLFANMPARVMGVYPHAEAIDLDDQQKLGADVVLASRGWLVKLHYQTQQTPQ